MKQIGTGGRKTPNRAIWSTIPLALMLIVSMAAAVPAQAQEGNIGGGAMGGAPIMDIAPVRPAEETVTVTFELTVEGEPPADATFFGYLGYEPAPVRLTDPDGDDVYTGSTPSNLVPAGNTQPALIVQGTGTRESQVVGTSPGDPITTIKDFGEVKFEEDTALSASISFEDGNSGGSFGSG